MAVLVQSKGEVWGALRLAKAVLIHQGRGGLLAEPVAAGDGLYIAEWHKTGDVVKLDRQALRIVWRVNTAVGTGKPAEGLGPARPWSDDLILMGGQRRIAMMEAASGKLRWTKSPAYSPHIWNGQVVAKRDTTVLLIDGMTGETTREFGLSWPTESFVLCDGRVIPSPLGGGVMCCLDLSTEQIVWQRDVLREMGELARFNFETNAIGLVPGSRPNSFVAARNPMVFGLSLNDGSIRWGAPVAVTYYDPSVHDERIYILLMDTFVCIDEATGQVVYNTRHSQLAEAFLARPGTIYGGKIAFAMESGHLAVFDLADGHLTWLYKHKVKLWGTAEADGRLLVTTDDGHLVVFEEEAR